MIQNNCYFFLNMRIFLLFGSFDQVSVLESAYAIQTNTPLQKFSRQQVLDCSYFKYKINGVIGNKGCKKGHDFHTFNYLKQYGAELATDYPSLGEVSNCKYQKNKVVANLSKIFTISSNPLLNLKALVSMLNKQPVLAYMYAPADFIHYKSGKKIIRKLTTKNLFNDYFKAYMSRLNVQQIYLVLWLI